jgi:glycosyltransferase involved in cell wall biosynthesis
MIGMLTHLPVSCTVHAFDIFTRSPAALTPRLSRCKFIAAISQFNIDYLRERCGATIAELCRVVHCGIDLDKFKSIHRDTQPGNMISVSQLTPKKGLSLAVETCAKLKERGITLTYNIVGDGPVRESLEKQIQQLGLQDAVRLLGAQPNDRLVPLLGRTSVFFMPCIQVPSGDMDGIPVAMMEAMACKVPVVSRAISGIPELVAHGVNGLLVEDSDPNLLADALAELLHDPDKVERFGAAARDYVQNNFDITRTAADLRTLIQTRKTGPLCELGR